MLTKPSRVPYARFQGFALVVTLSLMVLLAIVTLGLLSLSVISLRGSSQDEAQEEARSNAKLALMIALGELQKHAGLDTRVTAPSGIINEDAAPLTGVWRSWEGSDHESTGRPIDPDYSSKKRTVSDGDGRFLIWLVSGAAFGASPINPSALASKSPASDTIPLLSTGTLAANDNRQIHVVPQQVNQTGKLAWWVAGENQKARLPQPYQPATNNAAAWSDIMKSHAVADPETFKLELLLTDPSPATKAFTIHTANLIAPPESPSKPRDFFHDLSVNSIGLLTNTATGGWRKDLSLLTENWDNLPATGLPFFRIDSISTSSVSRPTPTSPRAAESAFYPWVDYDSVPTDYPIYQHAPVSTWHNFKDYATAYKRIIAGPGGSYSTPFTWADHINPADTFNYLHKIRTTPVIARVHWVFSHQTTAVTPLDPDPSKRTYNLRLLMTPVVTLWNPFNVSINTPANTSITLGRPLPCAFRHYDKDGNPLPAYRRLFRGAFSSTTNIPGNYAEFVSNLDLIRYRIPTSFNLAAGETRVFSPTSQVTIGSAMMDLSPGYNPGRGHTIDLTTFVGPLNANSAVKVDAVFDARFREGVTSAATGVVGIWLDMFASAGASPPQILVNRLNYTRARANQYWPPIPASQMVSRTAEEINGIWQPFLSVVYGSRISGPASSGLPGKGILQTSPLISYARMGPGYIGVTHPANAANDFSFFVHTGNDDKLPNANNTNNRGFIISGFAAADGLSRPIVSELPLRPLASLAELQNWDLRAQYGYPPYQLNIIGNSDATPLLPANRVYNTGGNPPIVVQYDDAYCANHLLFDDWFFSSIAPEPASFGNAIAADLQTRYKQYLSGTKPLTNRSYRPIPNDRSLNDATQTKLYNDIISSDGWQRVASRLEVEGMFNVNSTSIAAWRALLGHARDQRIPHFSENGIALSGNIDYALARSSPAGDTKAGEQGMSGSFPESSELTGYRVFDDALLDILAEKIVNQIRLRGPFLSLSEFVNRQLSNDKNLALAGAIQAALNQMSEQAGANDPYRILKSPAVSRDAGNPADPKLVGSGYQFPEAAIGKSTYGMPGWIRQADVLRPLAPILSARDDTFTIRAYGDSRDANGKILAQAWCEATLCRTRDYVDPADAADIIHTPVSTANLTFGRRYEITSFRWLSPEEI